ncbi:MAG: hypothetical protein KF778_21160 [Rhodocyclaceae bacterium]|nr:hypothetical protein [Rhodocyclaceae bacterium]
MGLLVKNVTDAVIITEAGEISAAELCRYVCPLIGALVSVREDGGVYVLRPFKDGVWFKYAHKKENFPFEKWRANKLAAFALLPHWQKSVTDLPSDSQLNEWLFDGVCETPDGDEVEPDGTSSGGVPSWLVVLKLM